MDECNGSSLQRLSELSVSIIQWASPAALYLWAELGAGGVLQVLLEVHNSYHYQRWFEELRNAIAAGRLAQYTDWFLQRRRLAAMGS